ncbi:hypothetical protein [Mycolicibacterium mengxianglii]|uniref:hypothetical protein n=1 Tax=Mycolicibacterium mengxianglii TaxID=2736649 RepID=UPI0018D17820|nr:hypothetical protein [Mycolicibacterium mengxianglii]
MAQAQNNQFLTRTENVQHAYQEWLAGLSDIDYLAELDRVRNQGIGNPTEP